ncbi:MFS transporter [Streptomyces pseudovenezuelae]|uniref:MFS family permease n=1 Tax=Streptomyces pseudovenezuelae TaxID=67350 RepID=A0ABT6L9X1_9ACTN|nr:MFS transporter [Streptomyces pseudovenezuelae]MDH6213105.1 MFS family permease [Streptomyces pseudovenezuelae]
MRQRRTLTLASSVAGAAVVALDGTVLGVARPTLQRDLRASFTEVQWTSTAYLIAVASLLVFSGRLGDRYGHQRTFAIGMLGFGVTSAGIGLAPGVGWVIGLRAVQGVFGALLQPATLGILRTAYPPDRLRMPIAIRTSAIGLAAAAGPVLGGALVAGPGWRAAFYLNVVPTLVFGVLALTARAGANPHRSHPTTPLNLPGALLLALTLAALVQALVALSDDGPTAMSVAGLSVAVAAAAGAVFLRHERRAASPLIPADVIHSPGIRPALGVLLAASAALNGTVFVAAFLLQDTLGLTAFRTALLSLPLAVAMILAAPGCALLLRLVGTRRTTVGAMVVLAAGILLLSRASGTLALCTAFALLGAGFGTVMVAITHVVVRQAPVESAGVAGGLKQTAMNIGPTLGVALATTLTGLGGGHGPALLVLTGVAGAGAVTGVALPKGSFSAINPGQPGDRAPVPARP